MRDLNASVTGHTSASPEAALALVNDIEGYTRWYPGGVKRAEVRERDADGFPTTIYAVLSLNQGPIQRDFEMEMAVTHGSGWITLARLPKSAGDQEQLEVTFRIAPGTDVTAEFRATLSIPGWLPLGGIEKAIPKGFLDAALKDLG